MRRNSAENKVFHFSVKRPKNKVFHSGERGGIPQKNAKFREKPPVIPAKAGIHYGRLILEFPRVFFLKNGVNAGICR